MPAVHCVSRMVTHIYVIGDRVDAFGQAPRFGWLLGSFTELNQAGFRPSFRDQVYPTAFFKVARVARDSHCFGGVWVQRHDAWFGASCS